MQYRYGDSNPGFHRERADLSASVYPDVPSWRGFSGWDGTRGHPQDQAGVYGMCKPARFDRLESRHGA